MRTQTQSACSLSYSDSMPSKRHSIILLHLSLASLRLKRVGRCMMLKGM